MSAVIVISIFLLVLTSFAVIRSKRSQSHNSTGELPPTHLRGLFSADDYEQARDGRRSVRPDGKAFAEQEQALRARAAQGDWEALRDAASAQRAGLYPEILKILVEQSDRSAPESLHGLANFIIRAESLRASTLLAERILESWKQTPARSSVPELLRISALSDDARAYEQAIETVFQFWREGRVHGSSAEELSTLFESEYWMLSPDARRSGAGFILKEKLSEMRRRQATTGLRESTPNTEAE